ncbi:hypothetical protein FocTR4_00009180 [Fusarium oxysporum f. sp. cubense]|uniref:Uncharacterized protein n=1 Tax=Fusarium oxysporum f. sp. cubense TaxID=61366 RepID=A0A5C6SUV7_FUSOC|nr:hypothetical protein FocTR4_00009180 [Fusarium oxysporum f. sp. cubense]
MLSGSIRAPTSRLLRVSSRSLKKLKQRILAWFLSQIRAGRDSFRIAKKKLLYASSFGCRSPVFRPLKARLKMQQIQ